MVGPSLSREERDDANARLKVGFVVLVTASGGLVALQAGGTPLQLAAAVGGGLVLGVLLAVFLQKLAADFYRTS